MAWTAVGCSSSADSEGGGATSTTTGDSPTTSAPGHTSTTSSAIDADNFTLTSSAFDEGGPIPATYACAAAGGDAMSPPLAWSGVPDGTATLVLVVHDPDAPIPGGFTHLVTTFDPDTTSVKAGAGASGGPMAAWIPMCPPSGEHQYTFTLYAFGDDATVPGTADKPAIDALADQALAQATLAGRFAKP